MKPFDANATLTLPAGSDTLGKFERCEGTMILVINIGYK